MIGGAEEEPALDDAALEERIRGLVAKGKTAREAAAALAPEAGLPKREIYARALAAREER